VQPPPAQRVPRCTAGGHELRLRGKAGDRFPITAEPATLAPMRLSRLLFLIAVLACASATASASIGDLTSPAKTAHRGLALDLDPASRPIDRASLDAIKEKSAAAGGCASGLQKYLYANADPVNKVDPTGYYSMPEVTAGIQMQAVAFMTAVALSTKALNTFERHLDFQVAKLMAGHDARLQQRSKQDRISVIYYGQDVS
jgi:hypothetical protein